jgi:hypothetical protein
VPDAFMLRQISTHPRIVVNVAGATSTDTIHRVRVAPSVDPYGLAVAAFNSVTFASAEIVGRSYGGGVLELEPSEAEHLVTPHPRDVPAGLHARVDRELRAGRIEEAVKIVDQELLVDVVGLPPALVKQCHEAWVTLRDRRAARGRKAKPTRG